MKLSQAVTGYLLFKSTQASETTIETDTVLLNQFLAWLEDDPDPRDVDPDTIRAYLEHHKARELSDHTLRRIHATISALYTWLASPEIELVSDNPVSGVPAPKLTKKAVKTLTYEQVQKLLAAADRARTPRRARALVLFLLDSGTRVSEAANVKLSDVDIDTGKVKVLGKGKKERFVYIGRQARSSLWLYISDERPEPARPTDDHLFLTADGYPLDRHSIRHIICRLSKWSGVKANPHLFRHTAAIERLRHGMDAFTLQKFLGHTTLDMTRKYLTALADEDIEVQARRTSPANNWRL